MISFQSDYNNGMLPEILEALGRTNDDKTPGYGYDHYTESAKQKIRKAVDNEEADVFFLVGGTQTNTTVIDSVLLGCEGVVCVETGHIPAFILLLRILSCYRYEKLRNYGAGSQ
jgi:threonine aldolase